MKRGKYNIKRELNCKKCGCYNDNLIHYRKICKKCFSVQVQCIRKKSTTQQKYRKSEGYSDLQKKAQKKFYCSHRESNIKRVSTILFNERVALNDKYVKKKLLSQGFSHEQIKNNPELIKIKRLIIKTKRLWKTSQN